MKGVHGALSLVTGLTLLAAGAVVGAEKPRAERPTYALGERWMRSDGVYDLVRIEKDLYIFAAGPRREIHLSKDLMLAKIQKGESIFEFDPPPRLAWPLEVGKWGVTQGRMLTPRSPGGFPASFTWKVEAYEDVSVIAGTFKAFRIAVWIERPRIGRRLEVQTWYAPEARQLVKLESQDLRGLAFQVVTVTASRPAEVSIELPELGHGIFTYYLLRGLNGAADLNRDGIVSLQELYEYVEQQVTRKSRAVGGNQHPVMKGELEGVLPLVKVGAR